MSSPATLATDASDFWSPLSADHPDLLFELANRFEALLLLPPRERDSAIAALLDLESGMPEKDLREFLGAELRALASLPQVGAAKIVESIEAFQRSQPADHSMRRTVALQGACRDLTPEELSRLEAVMPSARQFAGFPPVRFSGRPSNGHNGNGSHHPDDAPRPSALSRLFRRP